MVATQEEMEAEGFTKDQEAFARKTLGEIKKFRDQRDAIQEKITSRFQDLKANGILPKAAKRALQLSVMDEDKLKREDASEALCRKALGVGAQVPLEIVGGTES